MPPRSAPSMDETAVRQAACRPRMRAAAGVWGRRAPKFLYSGAALGTLPCRQVAFAAQITDYSHVCVAAGLCARRPPQTQFAVPALQLALRAGLAAHCFCLRQIAPSGAASTCEGFFLRLPARGHKALFAYNSFPPVGGSGWPSAATPTPRALLFQIMELGRPRAAP